MSSAATIVILDTSQSMIARRVAGKTRFELAQTTLKRRVQSFVGTNIHFGLKQFSDIQSVFTTLPLGEHSHDAIMAAVDRVKPTTGGTPLAKAIMEAVLDLRAGKFSRSTIICLTDGENNGPAPPTMEEAVKAALSQGIRIDTDPKILLVGFGAFAPNVVSQYDQLVRETGGTFLTVPENETERDIVSNANYALDVASGSVSSSTAAVISALQSRLTSVEERLSRFEKGEPAVDGRVPVKARGATLIAVSAMLAAIFTGWMVIEFSRRTTDKFVDVNGKLDSFANDLNKLWNLRGR